MLMSVTRAAAEVCGIAQCHVVESKRATEPGGTAKGTAFGMASYGGGRVSRAPRIIFILWISL